MKIMDILSHPRSGKDLVSGLLAYKSIYDEDTRMAPIESSQ
jgi:hypothetical protein